MAFPTLLITSPASYPWTTLFPPYFRVEWRLPPAFLYVHSQYSLSTLFLPPTPCWVSSLRIFHVLRCLLGRTQQMQWLQLSPVCWWLSNLIQILSRISTFIWPSRSLNLNIPNIKILSIPHLLFIYLQYWHFPSGKWPILPVIQERNLRPLQYCCHNPHSQLGVNFCWFLLFSYLFFISAFTILPPALP